MGDAALSLDPICGDGTGWALRGALLAAGTLESITTGLPEADALRHYALRLQKAFLAHLEACLGFYTAGSLSPAWEAEIDLMRRAVEEGRGIRAEGFSYTLERDRLVPLAS